MTTQATAQKIEENPAAPTIAPETSQSEAPVSANVKLIGANGADIMLTVRAGATVDQVTGVLSVMAQSLKIAKEKYHLTPAQAKGYTNGNGASQATNGNNSAPMCPDGHGPMKPSKKHGGYYCPHVIAESAGKKIYCQQKAQ